MDDGDIFTYIQLCYQPKGDLTGFIGFAPHELVLVANRYMTTGSRLLYDDRREQLCLDIIRRILKAKGDSLTRQRRGDYILSRAVFEVHGHLSAFDKLFNVAARLRACSKKKGHLRARSIEALVLGSQKHVKQHASSNTEEAFTLLGNVARETLRLHQTGDIVPMANEPKEIAIPRVLGERCANAATYLMYIMERLSPLTASNRYLEVIHELCAI